MQRLTDVSQVPSVFANLLQGVRACAPKCTRCTRVVDLEHDQVHVVAEVDGTLERLCHGCFMGDVAESLVSGSFR